MFLLLKKTYQGYNWLLTDIADPRANRYFMCRSPFVPIILGVFYLQLVKNILPKFMEKRKPYDLKNVIRLFNLSQVVLNAYILIFASKYIVILNHDCPEVDYTESEQGLHLLSLTHLYFITKLLDLADTIFFILRKKYGHVSFLHVYHHFSMVIVSWVGVKFIGGGASFLLGYLNVFVHVIMYSYYFLTAWDDKYKAFAASFKRHITQLQMVQFTINVCYYGRLSVIPHCTFPKSLAFLTVTQNVYFLFLFGDFYYKNYIRKPKITNPRANRYFMFRSVLFPIIFCALYLQLVKNILPKFMEKRKPYDLKNIIRLYNLFQVALNAYLSIAATPHVLNMNHDCPEVDYTESERSLHQLSLSHLYFVTKLLDLADTIFFILRKNHGQVSFLHVYHHFLMIVVSWIGAKFVAGGASLILGYQNVFVHVVMYSYYFLTAWNDKYKAIAATFKRHITQLQMVQFALNVILYGRLTMISHCKYPKSMAFFAVTQNNYFLYLFGDFYYQNYLKKPKVTK